MSLAKSTRLFSSIELSTISLSHVFAISAALLIGTFIIAGVGFAGPEIMHNAAHDVRHGLAFPCH